MHLYKAKPVLQSVAKVKSRNIYEVIFEVFTQQTIRLAEEFFFIISKIKNLKK